MMKIFKYFRRPKAITFLGRGGVQYNDGKYIYTIDTNNFSNRNTTIELLWENTRILGQEPLTISERRSVAIKVKELLEMRNYKVVFTPEIPINYKFA